VQNADYITSSIGKISPAMATGLGLLCVLGMACSWVAQNIVQKDPIHPNSSSLLTMVVFAIRIGYILIYFVWQRVRKIPTVLTPDLRPLCKWAFMLFIVLFFVALLWYLSIPMLPITQNVAISNVSPIFALFLSVVILGHELTALNIGGAIVLLIGVLLICFSPAEADPDGTGSKNVGFILCIIVAFLYSLYQVVVAFATVKLNKHTLSISYAALGPVGIPEKELNVFNGFYLFGVTGVFGVLLGWVFVLVGTWTELDPLYWPPTQDWWMSSLVIACFDFTFSLFLIIGLLITSPVFVASGQLIVIPLGLLSDLYIEHDHSVLNLLNLLGCVAILIGSAISVYASHSSSTLSNATHKLH
jgi:drug/metabolite transporter (DMT)-like permease